MDVKDSPLTTTTSFSTLPPELRLQIWQCAVVSATTDRAIRVAVHYLRYEPRRHSRKGKHQHVCMADGFFAVTEQDPEPEEEVSRSAIYNLRLVCWEAREVILAAFPQNIKVYQHIGEDWRRSSQTRKFRMVRCNPTTDVLVITAIRDAMFPDPQEVTPDEAEVRSFPRHAVLFRHFREIVSSFWHVGYDYVGLTGLEQEHEFRFFRIQESFGFSRLKRLLDWFESLKHFYVWPNPKNWPEIRPVGLRIRDTQDHPLIGANWHVHASAQNLLVVLRRSHHYPNYGAVDGHKHWVPQSRRIETMGLYASAFWVRTTCAEAERIAQEHEKKTVKSRN
ncbi:hypothetical protein SCUP515_02404 [Seiridium cupressi]